MECVTVVFQVFYRRCNLRELCHCAVAVRAGQLIVTFDICSRGYLQVIPQTALSFSVPSFSYAAKEENEKENISPFQKGIF